MLINSFAPIVGPGARVLILGTIPSRRSLEEGKYYAHPRNAFWRIMERLYADDSSLPYARRVGMLEGLGIAVWDVLRDADRTGSLDSAIARDSAVPNDIPGLLRENPGIGVVLFNGAKAESLFNRLVAPDVPSERRITFERLPSTSPAHAARTFDMKLTIWAAALDRAGVRRPR